MTHVVPPPLDPTTGQLVQPVLIDITNRIVPIGEILVQHHPWGIEVAVREHPGSGGWTPASVLGINVEARSS